MDFRDILQSLSTITEGETKETEKGRVHKGSYGRHYDTDEEGDEKKKEKKPEAKRGRGRPKKDSDESGEVKKYDTKSLHDVFGGGKKPKKEVGKTSKKHSLKEYIEEVETTKTQLDEMQTQQPIPVVSKQGDTQQTGAGFLNIIDNSPAGQAMKDALGKLAQQKKAQIVVPTTQQSTTGQKPMPPTGSTNQPALGEEEEKWIQKAVKHPGAFTAKAKAAGKSVAAYAKEKAHAPGKLGKQARLAQTLRKMHEEALDQPATMEGAPEVVRQRGLDQVVEKAPPGAKAERMVKHIKKSYAKDGKLTPKEKSIAYATAWKAHNKGKVEESMNDESEVLTEGAFMNLAEYLNDVLHSDKHRSTFEDAVLNKDVQKAQRLIRSIMSMDDNFRRRPHTLKTQLEDHCLEECGFTNYEESLMDENIVPQVSSKDIARSSINPVTGEPTAKFEPSRIQGTQPIEKPTPWKTDPIQATTDRAINLAHSLRKKLKGPFESKDMKDIQLESWEKELNNLLSEGLSVTSSTGQQGAPDSVSVNATDAEAEQLLGILRQSGMGIFGGEDKGISAYGAPLSGEEPEGHGTEPEMSPAVVGDGDDMMALIKKMTGIGGEEGSEDYADEEDQDAPTLEPTDSGEESEESGEEGEEGVDEEAGYSHLFKQSGQSSQNAQGQSSGAHPKVYKSMGEYEYEKQKQSGQVKEDDMEEGNAFGAAVAKAKADGIQKGETVTVGGKKYPVKEEDMEEGNKFTGNLAKARAAGKKEADLDGDGDMEKVREGEDTCNECGMYESECSCEHEAVEEGFSNDAGGDAMGDIELAKLKALMSMGNDLHKMKHSQAVGNPIRVAESEITDWKKLSGIK